MKLTSDHDIIFLRELLLFEPWNHRYGSKERGNCWERISESLNQLTDMQSHTKIRPRPLSDIRKDIQKTKTGITQAKWEQSRRDRS